MNISIQDCCVEIAMTNVEPVLELQEGDTDPFTDEPITWPTPRVYWSNGAITEGSYFTTPSTAAKEEQPHVR